MSEVGTYYITVMPSMNKFTAEVKRSLAGLGDSAGGQFSNSFMSVLSGSALGTMIGNLATTLGNELAAGLDVGIQRLDTLKNFPKVMEALGFNANEAQEKIKLIAEHLDGLPTATQDVVTLTQAIADSTGDLDLAARAALGFNDMLLANGASAGEITQAMGVFNRVLGKGNATVAQWQSLQSVMPAQLSLVAQELMGEGASVEALRDALNEGEISWDDFLQAIVKLDTEGTEHVKSFSEQARANSTGIGTALTNIQNRIGAGWAEILDAFGRENISSKINKFSYGIRDGMESIAGAIKWLKYTILGTNIDESIKQIFENIKGAIGSVDTSLIKDIARGFIDLVDNALKWIADNGETVGLIFSMIAGAVAAIMAFKLAMWFVGVQTAMSAFIAGLSMINIVGTLTIGAIAALVTGLVWFFTKTEMGKKIWSGFVKTLKKLWTDLKNSFKKTFDTIKQNIETNALVWKNFKENLAKWNEETRQKVIDAWNKLKDKLSNIVTNIKTALTNGWNAIKTAVTNVVNAIKTFLTGAWDNIKTTATTKANDLKTAITNAWNAIKTAVSNVVNGIKDFLTGAWDTIKTTATTKFNDLKTGVTEKFNDLKTGVSQKLEDLKTRAAEKWESMRSTARQKIEDLKTGVAGKFEDVRKTARTKLEDMKQGVIDKFNTAKSTASTAVENLKNAAASKWESIRSTARQKIEDMKSGVTEKFASVKDTASQKVQDVWDAIVNKWSGLSDKVRGIFDAVKSAISSPIETAKTLVSDAINKIKGYFDVTLSFPHIKLPHFIINGGQIPWGIGGKGYPPSISISWYAKGGVFDTAQIIGIGEAGREAALPLNEKTYREIAKGIADQYGGGGGVVVTGNTFVVRKDSDIDAIAEALDRRIRRERWATA